MTEARIADRVPTKLELETRTYWRCRRGVSKSQPFCDGSHRGAEFEPMRLTLEADRRVALCQCKRSEKMPHCDGSHRFLDLRLARSVAFADDRMEGFSGRCARRHC